MDVAFLKRLFVAAALLAGAAGPAMPQSSDPAAWDATWVGGWNEGQGSQVVIVGGAVIGFFWSGKYFTIENSTNLADSEAIKFIWPGGDAVVQRGLDGDLVLVINEIGKPETGVALKRE